jgi:tellurite resistance protein TerC
VGLAAVLVFVGIKMTITDFYKVPPAVSLVVITLLLGAAVVASVVRARRHPESVPKIDPDPEPKTHAGV